jgi:endonuclease YncB( thermonuclease family)
MTTTTPLLYVYPAQLIRVVDGDTVVLALDLGFHVYHHEHVRLAGVNAPEVFGAHASEAGRQARTFTAEWFGGPGAMGRGLVYHSARYDEREKYGRSLGFIYDADDGASLNDDLLAWLKAQGFTS